MKVVNDKIVEATESELYSVYLKKEWFEIYPFDEYMERMQNAGCEIVKE